MSKLKLGVIFGGMSTEHDVSKVSGTSIIKNLNKEKYDIFPIYIDKNGEWYKYKVKPEDINPLNIGDKISEKEKIDNYINILKEMDIIFPVLHGKYGEDGGLQGLLEMINKKYVGCKILSSSLCMDKAYTKIIFEKANINQAKYIYLKKYENEYIYIDENMNENRKTLSEICNIVKEKLKFPVFVKPSNSGSSVGVNKSYNNEELIKHIEEASKFDNKVLIEENINGREVECAVMGNEDVIASGVGEILPEEEFYTYDSKYKSNISRVEIPAKIPAEISEEIRKNAIKAFKAVDGKGISRVDFFIENETNKVLINEINTLPGFTAISMYPKLWESMGINYPQLLDRLIEYAKQ